MPVPGQTRDLMGLGTGCSYAQDPRPWQVWAVGEQYGVGPPARWQFLIRTRDEVTRGALGGTIEAGTWHRLTCQVSAG